MDEHSCLNEQSDSLSPAESGYPGSFFPNSRHFVVAGGTFTSNIITNTAPSDFLRVPLGSIDLHAEIRLDATRGVVRRKHVRGSVRHMYSARVVGHNEPMTVAVYEGDNAEREWKRDLLRYSNLRHPHIFQIYAIASSSGIHASIFHGDLIPFEQFLESFPHSVILQAYVRAYSSRDYLVSHILQFEPRSHSSSLVGCVHVLQGRDVSITASYLLDSPFDWATLHRAKSTRHANHSLFRNRADTATSTQTHVDLPRSKSGVLDSGFSYIVPMVLHLFHPSNSAANDGHIGASGGEIGLNTIFPHFNCLGWYRSRLGRLKNNSARCNMADVANSIVSLAKYHDPRRMPWLSVANYVFNQRQIMSNYEDYVLVDWVEFTFANFGRDPKPSKWLPIPLFPYRF
ncbi:hypothetical protein MSAN_00235800 [Mycena sanguinolenta]|uniref:Uncharacterized protein n=1 Tax=Mycena sanguinolenta TaxID=230812 RepID=A0A8H7DL35_9AGAR|nr:hypothetical protein MSAN_00235800 [Mycena sanguinolenta]